MEGGRDSDASGEDDGDANGDGVAAVKRMDQVICTIAVATATAYVCHSCIAAHVL
jgi:hypothetical protein